MTGSRLRQNLEHLGCSEDDILSVVMAENGDCRCFSASERKLSKVFARHAMPLNTSDAWNCQVPLACRS